MDYFYLIGIVMVVAFVVGGIPFFALTEQYSKKIAFENVRTRKYPATKTYYLPYFAFPYLGFFVLLDITKGVLAIRLGDYLLGTSDYSLILAAASCIVGNIISQSFIRRDIVSSLFLWGIFFSFNPLLTIVIVAIGGILYYIIRNIVVVQLTMAGIFLMLYVYMNSPISFMLYAVLVLCYIVINNQNVLRQLTESRTY